LDFNERLNQLTHENQIKIKILRKESALSYSAKSVLDQKIKEIESLQSELSHIQELMKDYKSKIETFLAQIEILESDIYEKEGTLTLLRKENEALKLNFSALERNYNTLVSKVSGLQLKRTALEEKKEKNREKIKNIKGENKNLEQLKIFLGNLKREIVGSDIDLEGKYQNIESIKRVLDQRNEEIMREITNLSLSLVNKKEELNRLSAEEN
jgi:chromosome segregation ATPase